jgi:hypothetical protein
MTIKGLTAPWAFARVPFLARESHAPESMRRLRRLQLAQVAALVVLCASLIVVALLFTEAIQDARAEGKTSARNESELLRTAAELRLADLGFWAGGPTERGARVAPTTRPRIARAQATLRRLGADELADGLRGEERGIVAGALAGVAALRAFAADARAMPRGPRAAVRARRESALGTAAVDRVGAWLFREHTEVERADARADRLTSRLTHWLVGLIGLLCACGLAICLVLERARRRVKQGLQVQMAGRTRSRARSRTVSRCSQRTGRSSRSTSACARCSVAGRRTSWDGACPSPTGPTRNTDGCATSSRA